MKAYQSRIINGEYNWKKGDPIVFWKRGNQDFLFFRKGENLNLENITVNTSLHYAIKLRGIEQANIDNCKVVPVPNAIFSSSADGIDAQQSRNIQIKNCTIIACGDDAISFLNHGNHGYNGEQHETNFPSPYPNTNEDVLIENNIIQGGNRNGILMLASKVRIQNNLIEDTRQYGIKFTGDDTHIMNNTLRRLGTFAAYKHIQDELNTGIICSDEWYQNNVHIENNTIENWMNMPGILLKSIKKAKVTNNTLSITNPVLITRKPINPYLNQNKAICLTHGNFRDNKFQCIDIQIDNNKITGWKNLKEAIHQNGKHDQIAVRSFAQSIVK